MDITVKKVDDIAVAEIAGELDGVSAPLAEIQLLPLAQQEGRLLLDVSRLTYMSSAGLRIVLKLYRTMTGRKGRIALAGPSEYIRDTMSMTGFLQFLPTYDSLGAGLKALKQAA